jgi:hypothetical protein
MRQFTFEQIEWAKGERAKMMALKTDQPIQDWNEHDRRFRRSMQGIGYPDSAIDAMIVEAREWAKLTHERLHETYPNWPCTDGATCAVFQKFTGGQK